MGEFPFKPATFGIGIVLYILINIKHIASIENNLEKVIPCLSVGVLRRVCVLVPTPSRLVPQAAIKNIFVLQLYVNVMVNY